MFTCTVCGVYVYTQVICLTLFYNNIIYLKNVVSMEEWSQLALLAIIISHIIAITTITLEFYYIL